MRRDKSKEKKYRYSLQELRMASQCLSNYKNFADSKFNNLIYLIKYKSKCPPTYNEAIEAEEVYTQASYERGYTMCFYKPKRPPSLHIVYGFESFLI